MYYPNQADDEDALTTMLRPLAIAGAGNAGDPAVIAEAKTRFAQFVAGDEGAVHPDLRSAVFSMALRNGGRAESVL